MHKECIEQIHVVVVKYFEDILKSTCILNMLGQILIKKKETTTKNKTKKQKNPQNIIFIYSTFQNFNSRVAPFHVIQAESLNDAINMIKLT